MKAKIGVRARLLVLAALFTTSGCADKPSIVCTMEAKACPDGSYVGRDPERNCEFNPCPER